MNFKLKARVEGKFGKFEEEEEYEVTFSGNGENMSLRS